MSVKERFLTVILVTILIAGALYSVMSTSTHLFPS